MSDFALCPDCGDTITHGACSHCRPARPWSAAWSARLRIGLDPALLCDACGQRFTDADEANAHTESFGAAHLPRWWNQRPTTGAAQ